MTDNDSPNLPAGVDSLLAAEGAHQAAVAITPYQIRVSDGASMLKVCSEAFGQLSALFGAITRDPDFSGIDAQRLAGAGRSLADDMEDRAWSASEDLRAGGNP